MILLYLVILLFTPVYCNKKKDAIIPHDEMLTALNGVFENVIGPMISSSDPKKSYKNIFYTPKGGPLTLKDIPDFLVFTGKHKTKPNIFFKLEMKVSLDRLTTEMEKKLRLILKKEKYAGFIKLIDNRCALLYSLSNSLKELIDYRKSISLIMLFYKTGTELLEQITKYKETCKREMPGLFETLKVNRANSFEYFYHLSELKKEYKVILKSDFDWNNNFESFKEHWYAIKYHLIPDYMILRQYKQVSYNAQEFVNNVKTAKEFYNNQLMALFKQFPDILPEHKYSNVDYNIMNNYLIELKRNLDKLEEKYSKTDKKESILFEGKPAYKLIEEHGSFEQYLQHLVILMPKELFEDEKILDMFVHSKTAGILSVTGTIICIVVCTLLTAVFAFLLYKYVYLKDTTLMYNYTPKFIEN